MGLSEAFSPAAATHTLKGMGKAAVVGYAASAVDPLLEGLPKWGQHGVYLGASFLAGSVMKSDSISQSLAAVWAYRLGQDMMGMHEDADWADQNALNEECEYMDEDGNPMYLDEETGQFFYLNEDEMMSDGQLLAAPYLADDNLYPGYINSSNY